MEYTIKQLADLAGVSTRTLRWYDGMGLVKPLRVTEAGYRIYGPEQVDALQQVLFYRELGMELSAIRDLMNAPDFNREGALQSHLSALVERRARLDGLILTVEKTIAHQRGDGEMSDREKFEAFKKGAITENNEWYGAEVRQKYGNEAAEGSNRKFAALTQSEYAAMSAKEAEIQARLEAAVGRGDDPAGPEGRAIALLHRDWLGYTWSSYSEEAHKALAQMYVDDGRFTAYYDKNTAGCAMFLRDAVAGL